jgi:hypothetical protein
MNFYWIFGILIAAAIAFAFIAGTRKPKP